MNIIPLSDKAIKVQWEKGMKEEREFVLVNTFPVPAFKVSEVGSKEVGEVCRQNVDGFQ
jgi:alpha-D-xyloside xylohydrolase